jgi:SP family arabinose:H+ symporter-like MFS transporter
MKIKYDPNYSLEITKRIKADSLYRKNFIAILMTTSSFGYAFWEYVLATSNSVIDYLRYFVFPEISTYQIALLAAILLIGALSGAIMGGPLSSNFGRRKVLLIGDILALIGVGLTMIERYETIIVGRILEGFVVGINSSVANIYTNEMIPANIRGIAGIINMTVMNFGMIIAVALGYLVPRKIEEGEINHGWRIVYVVAAFFPASRIIVFLFFQKHETPSWLVSKEKYPEALAIIKKIYSSEREAEVILEKLKRDRDFLYKSKKMTYKELFSKKYQKAVMLGIFLVTLHQFAGIGVIYAFSIKLFQYGLPKEDQLPILFTLILSIISCITTGLSVFCIERIGRRKQFLPSLFAQAIVCLSYGFIAVFDSPSNIWAKLMIILWPIPYSICMGALTFLYLSEILPDIAMSVVVPFNWICAYLTAQFFLPLSEKYGPGPILFFFGIYCIIGFILTFFYMIESKGRSKAELISLYSGVPMDKEKKAANFEEFKIDEFVKSESETDNIKEKDVIEYNEIKLEV